MAIYHLHVKNLSRSDERSAVAAAAYRAGVRLWNAYEDAWTDFSARGGVIHSEILAPEGAPLWAREREGLWNRAEAAEKRKDARLAKEIELALPNELGARERIALAQAYASKLTAMGLVVDLTVHDGEDGNPHAHMLVTTRKVSEAGFGKKDRHLDSRKFVAWARRSWQDLANAALGAAGSRVRIDHRTLQAQGVQRAPQTHQGPRTAERRAKRARARERAADAPNPSSENDMKTRRARDGAHSTTERPMPSAYQILIDIQREIEAMPEHPSYENMQQHNFDLAELHARRDSMVREVSREQIEEGLGLTTRGQKELLAAWDRQLRPRPPTEQERHELKAYVEERERPELMKRGPPVVRWEHLTPEQQRAEIGRRTRLDELRAERDEITVQIDKVWRRRFLSDQKKTQEVTPLMHKQKRIDEEYDRISLRDPQVIGGPGGDQDERDGPDQDERPKRKR